MMVANVLEALSAKSSDGSTISRLELQYAKNYYDHHFGGPKDCGESKNKWVPNEQC
jgi:hypothetical protein